MSPEPLYGGETRKAIENFPISGEPVPAAVIHWLGRIKGAAADVNGELGLLKPTLARKIAKAAAAIADGRHDEQFPIDVFQTGSGTSSNMNVNEVIAALAGAGVHANDHVNLGQSSNDVFPSAVHLAALEQTTRQLIPALAALERALSAKARRFETIVKAGRTHLMDAVPVTLGQEFAGYAAQIRLGRARVADTLARVAQIPLGGTATGTGLNTHPQFARQRTPASCSADRAEDLAPGGSVRGAGQPRCAGRAVGGAEGRRRVDDEDRAGSRADGVGTARRDRRALPARTAEGLIDHAGQGQPGDPRGRAAGRGAGDRQRPAITIGGMQGNFELNVRVPLIARNLLSSIALLTSAATVLNEKCVRGIQANRAGCARSAAATLAVATALNPYIGYDKATEIVQEATRSGRPLREVAREKGVSDAVLDEALDLRKMALG